MEISNEQKIKYFEEIKKESVEFWKNEREKERQMPCIRCKKTPSDGSFYLMGARHVFNPKVCLECSIFIENNIDAHIQEFFDKF